MNIVDWITQRGGPRVARGWERVNRNSLSQWWRKRKLRALVVVPATNRHWRRTQRYRDAIPIVLFPNGELYEGFRS